MGIRSLVAKFLLTRASAKVSPAPLSIPLEFQGKSLLVLLPAEQRDLTVVKQVLPEITKLFGEDLVYLLACPNTQVQSIFPSKGLRIISPSSSSVSWCRLPSQSFLDKLKKYNFDYIFDTNLDDNRFAARILLNFPAAIRFGSNSRLGHPFLNLEIKTKYLRDRRLIYQSILEVMANLSKTSDTATS